MKMLFKNIFYLIPILFLLSACQGLKDGLTGKKKSNSDEFLVKKKNPLVLPADFNKLPEPKTLIKKDKSLEEENELKDIITKEISTGNKTTTSIIPKSEGSLEKSILEKIKNN